MGDRGTAEDSLKRDSNETKTDHDIIVLIREKFNKILEVQITKKKRFENILKAFARREDLKGP